MSQPSKRLHPKSRAKTAYGLLTEIINVAEREPLRINMSVVLLHGVSAIEQYNLGRIQPMLTPACGTVGCIAGWTVTLRNQPNDTVVNLGLGNTHTAQHILGLSYAQGRELFYRQDLVWDSHKQTPEHAAAVVAHIRAFQQKYSKQLRAHRLPEVAK